MEKLELRNFAGLDNIDVELNNINIFIGKQASGKSITAKIIYFFKSIPNEITQGIYDKKTKSEILKLLAKKFINYFPTHTWSQGRFLMTYYFGEEYIRIEQLENFKIKISLSEKLSKAFQSGKRILTKMEARVETEEVKDFWRGRSEFEHKFNDILDNLLGGSACYNQTFVPAGRSFFANLQNSIFTFLSSSNSLDPFLVEFGSFYESVKGVVARRINNMQPKNSNPWIKKISQEIMGGTYMRESNKDFLIHNDKRKINVAYSSSGQQETLPLILILETFHNRIFRAYGSTLFIEEPEAHLFPEAQKKIVELISLIVRTGRHPIQIVITTHSPYILSSFNNLLEAGSLIKAGEVDPLEVYNIVPEEMIIPPDALSAFSMKNGKIESIIDLETGLVDSCYLDSVSEEIGVEFDKLINLN